MSNIIPEHDDLAALIAAYYAEHAERERREEYLRLHTKNADHPLLVIVKHGCPYIEPLNAGETGSFPPEIAKRLIEDGYPKEIEIDVIQ